MNINSSSLQSFISPISPFQNTSVSNNSATVSSTSEKSDGLEISKEGRSMGRMLKHEGDRQAHKAAFEEAYSSLELGSLEAESMTDEEITQVLTEFESMMGDHMQDRKSASDMSSDELADALERVQDIGNQMSKGVQGPGGRPPKGPPPGGGKGGPQGVGMAQEGQQASGTEEATDSEMIESLLELLEEAEEDEEETWSEATSVEQVTTAFKQRDMTQLMAQFSF